MWFCNQFKFLQAVEVNNTPICWVVVIVSEPVMLFAIGLRNGYHQDSVMYPSLRRFPCVNILYSNEQPTNKRRLLLKAID